MVERLNPDGTPTAGYWSNGHVLTARSGIVDGHEWLFLGGANNELGGGFLAVIDPRALPASAPASNVTYACDACPAARPAHFFVFPSTKLCGIDGGMAAVSAVSVSQSGQVVVNVRHHAESLPGASAISSADSIYTLSHDFQLIDAEYHSGYEVMHRYHEALGRLAHPFSHQTHRAQLFPVVKWDGSRFVEVPLRER
jgi:hypothetical protein